MKTEDTIVTKKKNYSTPELVEHGSLGETTHGSGWAEPLDIYTADPEDFSGTGI